MENNITSGIHVLYSVATVNIAIIVYDVTTDLTMAYHEANLVDSQSDRYLILTLVVPTSKTSNAKV